MTRRDRLIQESRHDPYVERRKPPEPSACPDCHAIFQDGRWQWGQPAAAAHEVRCPACHRIEDGAPAGILVLAGEFHLAHRAEILGLIRHVEEREAKHHPLKRIMQVVESDDELEITTCEANLALAIGKAVHHAYDGELDFQYPEGSGVLRARWTR